MSKTISLRFKDTPEDQLFARVFLESQREKTIDRQKAIAFVESLPDRYLRVLELIAINSHVRAIADELRIATSTVRTYRNEIIGFARKQGISCDSDSDLARIYREYSESDRPRRQGDIRKKWTTRRVSDRLKPR